METQTTDEIMLATRRALCEHGYAALTIQRIADESSLSTAAIHYHFDTKDELLRAFLEDLIESFEDRLACEAGDPRERLETFLEAVFTPTGDDVDEDFPVALMELKAQAPYHDAFRNRFVELDDRMHETVASAVRDGVEAGHFETADPERVAQFVVTVINGAHVRRVALDEPFAETCRLVEEYLRRQLGWAPGVAA